jgi:outer membrane immunogenic protein
MKKYLFTAALVAICACGFSTRAAAQWTGFYMGANAGWQTQDFKGSFPNSPGFNFTPGRADQTVGGFYGGYQFQNGNWVVGAETGFDVPLERKFASSSGTGSAGTNCGYSLNNDCEARLNSLFRAGGRLGWAFDHWLVYGTGGYARGLIQIQDRVLGLGGRDQASGYSDGWYAGGGIDFALFRNLFLGIEYKHYDLGRARLGGSGVINARDISATTDSVMARLTIKIGP